MFMKLIYILLVVFCAEGLAQLQANWSPCSLPSSRTIESQNAEIYVMNANCTTADSECKLYRNTTATLKIKFKALQSCAASERGIIARMTLIGSRKIEIPYGALVNPCSTMVSDDDNSNTCTTGIVKNKSYTYVSTFNVLPDFPQKSGIEVRVLVRCKVNNTSRRNRSLRLWKNHTGTLFICALLNNVSVE